MEVVADSNIIFSALISGKSSYLDIFRVVKIYVPNFIFLEIEKYEARIIKKTKIKNTFRTFVRDLFTQVIVIPKLAIAPESLARAYDLCSDIDEKDTPFLALSIELNIPLWTNDKLLIDGLRNKGYINIIDSEAIFALL
ncbi:MAG: PIN domain-containing protein [Cyanobacteriota bacterium]|nr:PIN domain-containing protein [Cyanobacteriota bacterium]